MPWFCVLEESAMTSSNDFEQFAKPPDGCDPEGDCGVIARLLFRDLMHAPVLADKASRNIIEMNCLVIHDDGSEARAPADMKCCWYNTNLLEYPRQAPHVAQALRYLEKRRAVMRHIAKPNWVRILLSER